MGTHPIFESDFDCLTESMSNLLEVAAKNPFNKPVIADAAPSCEFGSTEYYAKCMIGGALSCGLTHTAVVPLDLVKCRMQVDAAKYPSLGKGMKVTTAIHARVAPQKAQGAKLNRRKKIRVQRLDF